jgi:hypothetical protein
METRLFNVMPEFGIVEKWHYDEQNDVAHIESIQNPTAIIEGNKAVFNATDEHARYGDGVHHVARIPLVVLQDLKKRGIADDPKRLKAWLNDPENRFFRVRPGRV